MIPAVGIDIRNAITTEHPNYVPLGTGGGEGLGLIFSRVFYVAVVIAAIIVFMYFIWAGYTWLTAGGDAKKVESSKTRMKNALMGLAVIASVMVLGSMVNQFFGTPVQVDTETGGGINTGSGSSSSSSGGGDPCLPGEAC